MANRQVSKGGRKEEGSSLVSVKGLSSSSFPPSDKITAPLSGGRDKGGRGETASNLDVNLDLGKRGGEERGKAVLLLNGNDLAPM